VADSRQFGNPGRSGLQSAGDLDAKHCTQCEAMLADALDGTLDAADQAIFDAHIAHCGPCSAMLADARRGLAWLEMLKTPRPEPPAALLERILAQTSGAEPIGLRLGGAQFGMDAPAVGPPLAIPAASGNLLPFRRRLPAVRPSLFTQVFFQPRLAMTAAMAFLSIALTLNLTGVRLQDLHASDLRPTSLERSFSSVNARAVRYYESLRVVYELESRVRDLQHASRGDDPVPDAPPDPVATPAPPPAAPAPYQPEKPDKPAHPKGPGTSLREAPADTQHVGSLQLVALPATGTTTVRPEGGSV
jgi:hypothetical protein